MVLFPVLVIFFFTSLMDDGLPVDLPVGVVDLDNTSTSRSLTRRLDGFQMSKVIAHYPSVAEARRAIQRNEIYGFLYIPEGTTEKLLASRQPKISYYYSYTTLAAGALLMRDFKTISTLGSAAVGQATMRAKGYTDDQIQAFLQPVKIDLHQIANPWTNYNVYIQYDADTRRYHVVYLFDFCLFTGNRIEVCHCKGLDGTGERKYNSGSFG